MYILEEKSNEAKRHNVFKTGNLCVFAGLACEELYDAVNIKKKKKRNV